MVRSKDQRGRDRLRRSIDRLTRAMRGGRGAGGGDAGSGASLRRMTGLLQLILQAVNKILGLLGGSVVNAPQRIVQARQDAAALGINTNEFIAVSRRLEELGVSAAGAANAMAAARDLTGGAPGGLANALEQLRDLVSDPFIASQFDLGELQRTGSASLQGTLAPGRAAIEAGILARGAATRARNVVNQAGEATLGAGVGALRATTVITDADKVGL